MTREESQSALDQFRSSILIPLWKIVEKMGLGEHPGVTNPWMVKSPPLTEGEAALLMEWHAVHAQWRSLLLQHYEVIHSPEEPAPSVGVATRTSPEEEEE